MGISPLMISCACATTQRGTTHCAANNRQKRHSRREAYGTCSHAWLEMTMMGSMRLHRVPKWCMLGASLMALTITNPPQDIARGNSPPRGARPTMRERDRRATRLSSCCHFPNPSISTTLFLTTRSHHHPPCRRCGWKTRHAPSAWTRSSTSRMTWTRSCLSRPQTAVSTLVGFGWFPLALPDTFFCLPHTRC